MMQAVGDMKSGTDVLLRATVDYVPTSKYSRSVTLIFEGEKLGRVVQVPDDVLALAIGRSPNYGGTRE